MISISVGSRGCFSFLADCRAMLPLSLLAAKMIFKRRCRLCVFTALTAAAAVYGHAPRRIHSHTQAGPLCRLVGKVDRPGQGYAGPYPPYTTCTEKMMWVVSRFCSKLMGRLKLTVHQCTVHTHMPSSQRTCGRFCARDLVCVSVFVVWFSYINFFFLLVLFFFVACCGSFCAVFRLSACIQGSLCV